MRKLILTGIAGLMLAAPAAAAPTTLIVAMRDPGCHWFYLGGGPNHRNYVASARLRPPGLGLAHRCATVLVDLHHEATRIVAAREPPQAFRATEDDRVGVGPRLDREALRELLVKEVVESLLPCADRVDLARHFVCLVWARQATEGPWGRRHRIAGQAEG